VSWKTWCPKRWCFARAAPSPPPRCRPTFEARSRKERSHTDLASLELPGGGMALPDILDDLERQLILKAYREAKGVKTETARLLGIKPSALYYKLDKYRIA
jgi:DNA-binding NtrC family response regulator